MKLISFDLIRNLGISAQTANGWVAEMIAKKDESVLPPKISMKPLGSDVFYNTMPVAIPSLDVVGVKIVNRYAGRAPSLDSTLLLYRLSDGECLACMDGNWITAMRTGAVAAHSAMLFAKRDFSTVGMIGLGNTAAAALDCLLAATEDRALTVRLLAYKDQHMRFAARYQDNPRIRFLVDETPSALLQSSDVVLSAATYFDGDIAKDSDFRQGQLLIPIHSRGFGNCDLFFDRVYADDTAHVSDFRYFNRFRCYAEVSDVVCGRAPGRTCDTERILVYNIGIALHDVFFAQKIYGMLKDDAPELPLCPPTEKFWF